MLLSMPKLPAAGSTYRVQLHSGFTLDDAADIVPYLARLGITHLYCSPVLQATPGSTHGYDVVDHGHISADLGGRPALDRLHRALDEHGMGMVVDIVPNHMAAVGPANRMWWDVLENGPSSLWARAFDIDWNPPEHKLRRRVLVPILGDHYGRVLEAGQFRLARRGGSFVVTYFEHEVPVSPRTLDELLAVAAGMVEDESVAAIVHDLARAFGRLPHAASVDRASIVRRHRGKERLYSRLEGLCAGQPPAAEAVDRAVDLFNADFDRLDSLLQRQNYRLARWRVAGQELDYRRFFDIPGLIALRVEDRTVFTETHRLIAELVGHGIVDGLRVDHPDGLRDPTEYLERLTAHTGAAWVVVEKILGSSEELPRSWVAAGSTGYDFLNVVAGLFVDPAGMQPMTDLYAVFTGESADLDRVVLDARLEMMVTSLSADVERLTALMVEVCEGRRRYRDFTRTELRHAVRETLASLRVYRTYVRPDGRHRPEDIEAVRGALDRARARRPDLDPDLFDLLGLVLLAPHRSPVEIDLAMRFQQVGSAVTAKGVEDTAFYRYVRLLALNEVGSDPGRFGVAPVDLHAHNELIARDWPLTMLATSTHDTKRSEDVRARLAVLSEMPTEWAAAVFRWSELAERHWRGEQPDRHAEYVLFQTVVGAHPIGADRAGAYMEKAVREAKRRTSWTEPDAAYEAAVAGLVEGLLSDPAFTADAAAFAGQVELPGRINSLAQTLLKLTSPGVPDVYQGCEAWDLSLVDPDNRRPVDHARLASLLDEAGLGPTGAGWAAALAKDDAGRAKLALVHRTLQVRKDFPDAFDAGGTYRPLPAGGAAGEHAVAYERGGAVVVVVPRLVVGLERSGGWRDTNVVLPSGRWSDRLTGRELEGRVPLSELLADWPVGLLTRSDGP